jgi:hypothetical protein
VAEGHSHAGIVPVPRFERLRPDGKRQWTMERIAEALNRQGVIEAD